ncbi:MAG: type I-E CRISPR-associated protein Cas5/CasD [Rhodobacteraceae bacterium]|nr:type I-E CRISPR-associated protein Cas5/CasD [Paracoccaceae bacterium]
MGEYLVFTLSATVAAMGDLAGHERRGSLAWPGRSAVLGLVGAALGLKRGDDFSALDALEMGVAVFDDGVPLRDYHTVQTVPSAAVKAPNSRPQALRAAGLRLNTTITLRDYRVGVLYGVALWGQDLGHDDLEPLKQALNAPRFTLYLGRKSCPLSAPPGAAIHSGDTPEDALRHLVLPPWAAHKVARSFVTTAAPGDTHVETRHDAPRDRAKWHFAPRQVAYRRVEIQPEGAA